MHTTTPAIDTRPSFFAFRLIRHASIIANILRWGTRLMQYMLVISYTVSVCTAWLCVWFYLYVYMYSIQNMF